MEDIIKSSMEASKLAHIHENIPLKAPCNQISGVPRDCDGQVDDEDMEPRRVRLESIDDSVSTTLSTATMFSFTESKGKSHGMPKSELQV